MKKMIVTLCSLVLSLAATLGANQLQPKDEAVIDNNKEQVTLEQEAEVVEDTANLPEDEIDTEETIVEDDKASELEETTPNSDNTNKKDTEDKKENNTENKTEDIKAPVTNNNDKKANNKNSKKENKDSNKKPVNNTNNAGKQDINSNTNINDTKQDTNNDVNSDTNNNTNNANNNNTVQININDYFNDFKSNGKNLYVYKNVDLSNCDSIEDVVEELQKNGYKKFNKDNIQNISSLEEILSLIQTPTKTPTTPKQEPTTPKQPTHTTTPTNPSNNSYADEVLRLVNIERNKAGLSNLTTTSSLTAAANRRAQETKTSFSHTRPNGTKFSTVLQEYGVSYRTAGENIAYGQRSPQEVVTGWMNSPGHRANILNGSFNKIGIGVYQSGGVIYWSQLFTN